VQALPAEQEWRSGQQGEQHSCPHDGSAHKMAADDVWCQQLRCSQLRTWPKGKSGAVPNLAMESSSGKEKKKSSVTCINRLPLHVHM